MKKDDLLDQLRAELHAELTTLDEKVRTFETAVAVVKIHTDKARNVALEALSEIRNIRASLTTAASTKPSPGTRHATARSRSRGRRV
jgi:hypothetical protein